MRPIDCFGCWHYAVRPSYAKFVHGLAFKSEADLFPNYGKTVGMNPSQWWSNVRRLSVGGEDFCLFDQA